MLSACLTAADSLPVARPDIASLSDQTMLELLVSEMTEDTQKRFQDPDGAFTDLKDWREVYIRRDDTAIGLSFNGRHIAGTILLDYLPRKLTNFDITRCMELEGTMETSGLPHTLCTLAIEETKLTGTFDFRTLPDTLTRLTIVRTPFHGSCDLTALPTRLERLKIMSVDFSGSIVLTQLPAELVSLRITETKITGEIDLGTLPPRGELRELNLSDNALSGSISLENLPRSLAQLDLSGNQLSGALHFSLESKYPSSIILWGNKLGGELDLHDMPECVSFLDVSGNLFHGDAFIHSNTPQECIDISDNEINYVFDENGVNTTKEYAL